MADDLPDPQGEPSDDDLVRAVRDGDVESFGELYRRYEPMAASVARRAGMTRDDADDVVAEAYAKLLRALHRGRGPRENFPGYLAIAVRRVAWTVLAEARRCRPTDDLDVLDHEAAFELDDLRDTDIGAALAALSPQARALLWRLEVEGATARDLASEDGRSPNAVAAAAMRARKRLRTEYDRRPRTA